MALAFLVGSVPLLTAQTNTARLQALYYSHKLGTVSSSNETLVKTSPEKTELFVTLFRKGEVETTLIATEPGYGNPHIKSGSPMGEIYILAGLAGARYQIAVRQGALVLNSQQLSWRDNAEDHIVFVTDPLVVKTIPTLPQENWVLAETDVIDARTLFSRDLSLQPQRLHGNDVWVVQHCLVEQDFTDVGEVDGWFGPATKKAVTQFQGRVGLPVTGTVDADTWQWLAGPDEDPPNYEGD